MKDVKQMRIWNRKALANDFAEGRVSQKQRFYYFIGLIVLLGLHNVSAVLTLGSAAQTSISDILIDLLYVVCGTYWCFRENRSVDDQEFVDRFVAFGFINTIRVFLFSYIYIRWFVFYVGVFLAEHFHFLPFLSGIVSNPILGSLVGAVVLELPIYFFWFYLVRSDIRRIKKLEKGKQLRSQEPEPDRDANS